MSKKILSIILASLTIAMYMVCIPVFADDTNDVATLNEYAAMYSSRLTISGNTATCESIARGSTTDITKIAVKQYLQKRNSNGTWTTVTNGVWLTTSPKMSIAVKHTKSSLTSGIYRLKSDFTFFVGSSTEKVTAYSTPVTI